MRLKNLIYKTENVITNVNGKVIESTTYHLYRKEDRQEVTEFTIFMSQLLKHQTPTGEYYSANTVENYKCYVIKFLDYLHESGVMGAIDALELSRTKRITEKYPDYIRNEARRGTDHEILTLRALMEEYRPKLSGNSINMHLNAVEFYIITSEQYAVSAHNRMLRSMGISPHESEYQPLFEQVWQSKEISHYQKLKWQQVTMLGGVLGAHNNRTKRTQVFKREKTTPSPVRDKVCITQAQITLALSQGSLNHRDLTLYAFLFASGLRISEALLLQFCHIDFANRRIFLPPKINRRGLTQEEANLCSAWKGRETKDHEVLLFGEAADVFWKSLNSLLKNHITDFSHDFLFTFVKGAQVGRPFILTQRADDKRSHSNLVRDFKKTLLKVGISEDAVHGPHFCRHSLVFYLNKDAPRLVETPDGAKLIFGYPIEIVSRLIGHKSLSSTMKYKRDDAETVKDEHAKGRDAILNNLDRVQAEMNAQMHYHLTQAKKIQKNILRIGNKNNDN
ncbi:Tyr recombinase domain-containing protein [Vibrio crassostreae]|uniref:tyrosine-type recombinase/integrase n=1 Tax=Vibrio TaxID=662 RepID=UPI001B307054|nr:site-specific integrase [Vibrio crassostreae]CAK1903324.1 Tyr recombinase domain-containing protein [Vibrio crassostreae]CAK3328897.1 Tyr recombinase domain-containing protein [Vibrio crassostreae]